MKLAIVFTGAALGAFALSVIGVVVWAMSTAGNLED